MSAQLPVETINTGDELEFGTLDLNYDKMETSKKVVNQLENRLSVKDIMKIQKVFMQPNVEEFVPLNRKSFIDNMFTALGYDIEEEYGDLFDRIDVARDGFVDWNKVTTFMLLELYENEDRTKSSLVPQWKEIKFLPTHHKEPIQSIAYLKNSHRYLSLSKEGWMNVWGENLKLQQTLRVTTDSVRLRDLWVTSMVSLTNVNKVAVAFTSKEICFYDLNSKDEFFCQYKLHGIYNTLISMHYWFNADDGNQAVLTFGDVCGEVNAICFTTALISLFERPTNSTDEQEATVTITWQELFEGNHKCCFTLQHKGHNKEWVRQVSYCSNLEAFISCATSNLNTLVLGWKEKGTTPMKTTSFHVNEGVNAFDYHPGLNLIASAAVNHRVYLWNPYMSKPTGILRGHLASVIGVQFNSTRRQLFSFSKDKVLRIWDLQNQLCIQRLAGIFPKCLEFQTILYFNETNGQLFTTFNNQLTLLEMKQENSECVKSHEKSVTCVLYNSLFKQVISSDIGSTVIVWMIETGQKVKQFTGCHGNSEITTMALDASETKFFTASVDGTVKIWDFNGHCHHKLNAGRDQAADISQILILRRSILVLGWERIITVFRTDTLTEFVVQPSEWKGKAQHQNDILCAAFLPPQTLVTGSYDGEIVVWNNNSEKVSSRFHPCLKRALKSESDNQRHELEEPQALDNFSTVTNRYSLFNADNKDDEFNYIVSRLFFLEGRKNASSTGGANLIACGGCGIVRFWNTFKSLLLAEFEAHVNAASIIMTVDKKNDYLITGDMNGRIKVWNIQEYCLCSSDKVISEVPPMVVATQPHNDCISHLETCVQDGRLLILSASADCSIVLSDVTGSVIGVFGQDEHWRIGECSPPSVTKIPVKTLKFEKIMAQKHVSREEHLVVSKHSIPVAEEEIDHESRLNIWKSTILGNIFRENRIQKKPRPRLSAWGKLRSPIGTFSCLQMEDLEKITDIPKPDFLQNPNEYFDVNLEAADNEKLMFPTFSDTLKVAFDEKSLFPEEILGCEHKVKLLDEQNLNGGKAALKKNTSCVKLRSPQRTIAGIKLRKQLDNSIQK
ncbi:WD repeat-containing protein 49-like isoform X1 [Stegostoma tigrinum]|uniref:WD repeat-containing protein 49-like isoform X1 n=1 Tax=Stegostoma tigrinum TaxID=3053191 RepID=UPI002870591B|nr:WD repeat-containing protein 49-like isoform X1 [Stegostoma tigrinum]